MKGCSVEKPQLSQVDEILYMTWGIVRIEANGNLAKFGRNRCSWVFFLELYRHAANVTRVQPNLQRSFRPLPGSIRSHKNPPVKATAAASPREAGHPHCSATQGVRLGEIAPPRLAPMFIKPERLPACVLVV